jgi:beta-phosphoglucomutase
MDDPLGVIFDMDGVLVDSYAAHLRSWRDVAARDGLKLTDEDFARTFGRTSRDIIGVLWPGKFNDPAVARFDADKEARYREILAEAFPEMDGASDLIRALHDAGFRLAIGSSGPPENVALVLRELRSGGLFGVTVNGTEVTRGKPNPDVFLMAARKLNLDPSRCAVIEDAPAGVEAARRAGAAAIGLLGTAPRERLAEHADLIVASLRDLSPHLIRDTIARRLKGFP